MVNSDVTINFNLKTKIKLFLVSGLAKLLRLKGKKTRVCLWTSSTCITMRQNPRKHCKNDKRRRVLVFTGSVPNQFSLHRKFCCYYFSFYFRENRTDELIFTFKKKLLLLKKSIFWKQRFILIVFFLKKKILNQKSLMPTNFTVPCLMSPPLFIKADSRI